MSPIIVAAVLIFCAFCGTHLGMGIRNRLPNHHLTSETREVVKLGAALIATLTALVLGLLINSARDTLDAMNRELIQDGAKIILLDRTLANYGTETSELREQLRVHIDYTIKLLWQEETPNQASLKAVEDPHAFEKIQRAIRILSPRNSVQTQLQVEMLQLSNELALSRWLIIETTQRDLSLTFLVVLTLWLVALYTCYGLIAPENITVRVVLFVSALSIAGAVFLIMEMSTPFSGVIKVTSAPLHKALSLMGR